LIALLSGCECDSTAAPRAAAEAGNQHSEPTFDQILVIVEEMMFVLVAVVERLAAYVRTAFADTIDPV
jgi:hypothetical protein